MRGFSKVYSNLWGSSKFNALTDNQAKLAYLYLLTSPHSNSSGCFDIKLGYAMADLNFSEHEYRMSIDSLAIAGLIEVENGYATTLITNWVEFNEPMNAKHALSVLTHLNAAASITLKTKRAQEFIVAIDAKKQCRDLTCGAALERLCQPYRIGIDTVFAPKTLDTDLDKDHTLNLDARENSRPPLRAVAALTGDDASGSRGNEEKDNVSHLLKTNFLQRKSQ